MMSITLDKPKAIFGWRGWLFEFVLWLVSRRDQKQMFRADALQSIFVLRNNDLGDVLVTTPLLRALHERFPAARICVGVGDWARPILERNPFVQEIVSINAPWANKFVKQQGVVRALKYIWKSAEVRALAVKDFDLGIDIFGCGMSAALLLRCGARYRVGINGSHGGWNGVHWAAPFSYTEHVSAANVRIADHLKKGPPVEAKPELYLSEEEEVFGQQTWTNAPVGASGSIKVVVGPFSGQAAKNWPIGHFEKLIGRLSASGDVVTLILGGRAEREVARHMGNGLKRVHSLAGELTLRETFAVVSACDIVICNSSMLLHASAAFRKATIVVLGPGFYESAEAHEALWGYPDLGPTLGGFNGGDVASVDEVWSAACESFTRVRAAL